MRLAPSEEQRGFAAVLHELLADSDVAGVSAAWAEGDTKPGRRLWAALADIGVTGLAVPERWGGLGAGPDDLMIACEELGHHAVPGPVPETLAAVPALLTDVGWPDDWLPEIAGGRMVATMAVPPWLPFAVDGDTSELLLLVTGDDVRLGRPGRTHRSMHPARRLTEVRPGVVLATGQPVERALDLGMLACAAQLLGAGRALLEMSVDHARTRHQFGRPIGSFQAVQHHLADVAVALEFARPLLYAAAVALTPTTGPAPNAEREAPAAKVAIPAPTPGRDVSAAKVAIPAPTPGRDVSAAKVAIPAPTSGRDVSAAKVACGEAALLAARTALQVHGAIGYTREHGLSRWLTLVRVLQPAWGTPAWHRGRILAALTSESTSAATPTPPPADDEGS